MSDNEEDAGLGMGVLGSIIGGALMVRAALIFCLNIAHVLVASWSCSIWLLRSISRVLQ